MKSARESGVKARIVAAVRASGRFCRRLPGTIYQAGLPDIVVQLRRPPGRALWLEVKQPGKKATKLQEATMAEIRAGGGAAGVVYSADEAMAAIAGCEEFGWSEWETIHGGRLKDEP